jgi:hypothetical protein
MTGRLLEGGMKIFLEISGVSFYLISSSDILLREGTCPINVF